MTMAMLPDWIALRFASSIEPTEIEAVRVIWWRQIALGHRLPAELGVILISGGK